MPHIKASDIFVKALENEGVKHIFAVPGEENLDLIESIRTSRIQLVITRHEQAAGFMAATYGRLTGKTGVCLSTLGPGATNLMTAAAYAQLGAMPILMITGQKPIKESKQGKFQMINVVEMMRPLTKFTKQIVEAGTITALVRESFRISQEERPGAVHLELPEDIAHESAACEIFTINPSYPAHANTVSLEKAGQLIHAAKRPLLLIGAGANRKPSHQALREFIDHTKIPFFNTQMGKGVIDERHPLFLGTAALSEHDYLHCAIHRADLIINVGHDIVEKPPFLMQRGGTEVIHINFFAAFVDEVYFPQLEVVGDISHSICQLKQLIDQQPHWDFEYFTEIKQAVESHIKNGCDDERFPMLPQRVVHDVRTAVPANGILTLDNGMYKIWFARNYKAYESNTVLLDNALATMGAGLPSAIATAMIYPERKVVAICGDGGFMMNGHELETAARLNVNLVIIILRDNAYGMIKWKQEGMGFTDFGLDFTNPDFVQYARSFGVRGHKVQSSQEFLPILSQCLEQPGIDLIDLPVDYSENHIELGTKLEKNTCLLTPEPT